jgi:hypothetical protein
MRIKFTGIKNLMLGYAPSYTCNRSVIRSWYNLYIRNAFVIRIK